MVSRNTTLVPSLGLRIGPAREAGLSVGMRRERVPPQRIKIKIKKDGRDPATILNLKKYFSFLQSNGHINILCHIFNSARSNQVYLLYLE